MKKYLCSILLTAVLSPLFTQAQNVFTITGRLSGKGHPQKAYLLYTLYQHNEPHKVIEREKQHIDSSDIRNGQFKFKGSITDPVLAVIKIRYRGDTGDPINEYDSVATLAPGEYKLTYNTCLNDKISFMLGPGAVSFVATDSLKYSKISGSKVSKDYQELAAIMEPLQSDWSRQINHASQMQLQEGKTPNYNTIIDSGRDADIKLRLAEDKFAQSHLDSYVGLWAFNDVLHNWRNYRIDSPRKYFEKFSPEVRATLLGKEFADSYRREAEAAKLKVKRYVDFTLLGKKFPDFTQQDIKGKPFRLSSLKGKYVLIDFWASWCAPCRAMAPDLVKAYQTLKNKNLEIVGVSLDTDGKAWRAAVKADGMTWIQVSDLQGSKNALATELEIGIIPQNFLIDPNGVIIGMKIFGEDTAQQLAKLMKLE